MCVLVYVHVAERLSHLIIVPMDPDTWANAVQELLYKYHKSL